MKAMRNDLDCIIVAKSNKHVASSSEMSLRRCCGICTFRHVFADFGRLCQHVTFPSKVNPVHRTFSAMSYRVLIFLMSMCKRPYVLPNNVLGFQNDFIHQKI